MNFEFDNNKMVRFVYFGFTLLCANIPMNVCIVEISLFEFFFCSFEIIRIARIVCF